MSVLEEQAWRTPSPPTRIPIATQSPDRTLVQRKSKSPVSMQITKNNKASVTPTQEPTPSTSRGVARATTWMEISRIVDLDTSEEEIDVEALTPPRDTLQLKSMIKVNRIDEVDASLILENRTRGKPRIDHRMQLDNRTRREIRADEKITKFIGTETRRGPHHHRKSMMRERKKATWRIKTREGYPAGVASKIRQEREHRRKEKRNKRKREHQQAESTGARNQHLIHYQTATSEKSSGAENASVPSAYIAPGGSMQQHAVAGRAIETHVETAAAGLLRRDERGAEVVTQRKIVEE
ncbi:uncharacterized protein LOC116851598 [Odontomachus brunneus]|uniref:uncharacterized protein LOC116851598 n=1 Tax=Odontomachus brunneus TaxID=486640 RepID=UPI0013F22C1A|nr:uncharacterized protein LOC116851598 [Odontomachus brunneus]